jgi:hypothetical protein
MRQRRLISVLVLVLWAFSGALALMCSGCAAMGDCCTSLCVPAPGAIPSLPSLASLLPKALQVSEAGHLSSPFMPVPTPPPKGFSVSA